MGIIRVFSVMDWCVHVHVGLCVWCMGMFVHMHMGVHVCALQYMCTCLCTCVHVHLSTYVRTYGHIFTYACLCTHGCIGTFVHAPVRVSCYVAQGFPIALARGPQEDSCREVSMETIFTLLKTNQGCSDGVSFLCSSL